MHLVPLQHCSVTVAVDPDSVGMLMRLTGNCRPCIAPNAPWNGNMSVSKDRTRHVCAPNRLRSSFSLVSSLWRAILTNGIRESTKPLPFQVLGVADIRILVVTNVQWMLHMGCPSDCLIDEGRCVGRCLTLLHFALSSGRRVAVAD
jgi:hypothetical protein